MDWRAARTAVAALVLGILGSAEVLRSGPAAGRGLSGTTPSSPACPDPVRVDSPSGRAWLICQRAHLAALLVACPADRPVHRGDRLQPMVRGARCRSAVRPLTAGHRLRLGLRLDINRASAVDLTHVRGIGPATARRIVAGRPWPSVDALVAVRGLGPRRLARIAPGLRATSPPRLQPWLSPPPPAASSPRRP